MGGRKTVRVRSKKIGAEMSRAERAFQAEGKDAWMTATAVAEDEQIARMMYEPVSFRLPGGSYTPDFQIVTTLDRLAYIEVKMSVFAKGYRDSKSKLRAAACLHPEIEFYEARWEMDKKTKKRAWKIMPIPPDGLGWTNGA